MTASTSITVGPLRDLEALGQSVWFDNMRRALLTSGELERGYSLLIGGEEEVASGSDRCLRRSRRAWMRRRAPRVAQASPPVKSRGSCTRELDHFADQTLSAMRSQFGGHVEKPAA